MSLLKFSILIFLIGLKYKTVESHGRLLDPPARSSCWREFPDDCKAEYTDNQMYCGGAGVQWQSNGGKCGICGDNWTGPRNYERGGSGYTGFIVRSYTEGQTIDVKVELTANHLGWFEFRLCDADSLYNSGKDATHECLDQNLLKNVNGETRKKVEMGDKVVETQLVLPKGLTCERCVFQWKYHTGNTWNMDHATGESGLGIGPQEEFYGCSDVRITGSESPSATNEPVATTIKSTENNNIPTVSGLTTKKLTTKPTTKPQTINSCLNDDLYYADKASGCKKFSRCINGRVYYFVCRTGTLFDEEIGACNPEELVKCS